MNAPHHEKICLSDCDKVRLKLACSATDASKSVGIFAIATKGNILSRQRTMKALFRLYMIHRFSHDMAQFLHILKPHAWQNEIK